MGATCVRQLQSVMESVRPPSSNHVSWSQLPDDILLKIFSMLTETDLVHVSKTCTNWNRVSRQPSLWRTKTFMCSQLTLMAIHRYVPTHGHLVQDLRIDCSRLTTEKIHLFTETIFRYFLNLDKGLSKIKSLHITNLQMDTRGFNLNGKNKFIIRDLTNFIQRQTKMEELHINNGGLFDPFDKMILESVLNSPSLQTVKVLNIVDFSCSSMCGDSYIGNYLKEFKSLERLELNFSLFVALRFDVLWYSLKDTLRCLDIHGTRYVDRYMRNKEFVDSNKWLLLVHLFPEMKVYLTFLETEIDPVKYLVEGIPLVGFKWREQNFCGVSDRAEKIINLLVKLYSQTLTTVSLDIACSSTCIPCLHDCPVWEKKRFEPGHGLPPYLKSRPQPVAHDQNVTGEDQGRR